MTETNWQEAIRIKTEMLIRRDAEIKSLRAQVDDLKRFAYEEAPRIAAEEANKQIDPLKEEIKRLRDELGYIANAKRHSFRDAREFRAWAQNRAQHALNQQPGALTIKR